MRLLNFTGAAKIVFLKGTHFKIVTRKGKKLSISLIIDLEKVLTVKLALEYSIIYRRMLFTSKLNRPSIQKLCQKKLSIPLQASKYDGKQFPDRFPRSRLWNLGLGKPVALGL